MTKPAYVPVVDVSRSPSVALRPVSVNAVQLQDTFWQPRLTINRDVTLPAQLRHCEQTGRIDNFRRAAGKMQGAFKGLFPFDDSDIYKWVEAASWSLATHADPKLEADVDAVIQEIAAAQQPDGYLNTYFMFEREGQRFTNLKDMHEIYCAGHLLQAAVAHHRATGKTTLLNVAVKLADHLDRVFGPEPKRLGACGHEEAEMALVELYRETGEVRYLDLAKFMIEARGRRPGLFGNTRYHQDHLPFIAQTEMTGHAVRHLYFTCGAADVYAEQGNAPYLSALQNLWENLTARRMYVTGGAGSRWEGEAFGEDFELPNERAYTETCAAIGSVMWNWRMLNITGDARYADLMEQTLYNAVLPGLSLDGTQYFYQNPLADRGKHRRQEWFGCACCPPNVARLLASLPGYFYSASGTPGEGVYVHLYATSTATIAMSNGGTLTIAQKTDYPWNGKIEITVTENSAQARYLYLRIPEWAGHALNLLEEYARIEINGAPTQIQTRAGTYAQVPLGEAETNVVLNLPMDVEYLQSHPHVLGNRGRVALQRGPLIYCLEQADHPDADVWDILLNAQENALKPEFLPDLLGGVMVLRGEAMAEKPSREQNRLYRPWQRLVPGDVHPAEITAIPYYAWANRDPGPMQVWVPVEA